MTDRDRQRLKGVHPKLVTALEQVFTALAALGHAMFVVEGLRSTDRQKLLYSQGRTRPGAIVTYKDGVTHRSNHQPHEDGWGYATDLAFVSADPFNKTHPWALLGAALEGQGLIWGGRWRMADLPHAELPIDTSSQLLIKAV